MFTGSYVGLTNKKAVRHIGYKAAAYRGRGLS